VMEHNFGASGLAPGTTRATMRGGRGSGSCHGLGQRGVSSSGPGLAMVCGSEKCLCG
jgi:hypothetical protein